MPKDEVKAIKNEMVSIIGMGFPIQDDKDEEIAMQAAARLEFDGIIDSNGESQDSNA